MNHVLAGWTAYWRERKDHQATSEAYDAAILQLQRALNELAKPCVLCEEAIRERNNAVLDLDTLKADLDVERQARRLMETLGFAGIGADGDPT